MFPKTLVYTVAAAFAVSDFAFAQTFTECNPMEKTCSPNPALGTTITCDFTRGECDALQPLAGTNMKYDKNGAIFNITHDTDAPTLRSDKYIFFGRVEAKLRSAPGPGIVTAVTLLSDNLDEIDFEWIGNDDAQVQSNYFGKSDVKTWDRGGFHGISNPSLKFHKYTIDWTKDSIKWLINDKVVRELKYQDAKNSFQYPQTPMRIKPGTWSPDDEGSQAWAGGPPDFSKSPFVAYLESITIVDYAGGDKPAKGGVKEYVWADRTGSWESIQVVKDKGQLQHKEEAVKKTNSGSASSTASTSNVAKETSLKETSLSAPASGNNASTTHEGPSSGHPKSTTSDSRVGPISTTSSSNSSSHPTGTPLPQSSAARLLFSLGSMTCICFGVFVQHLL